MNRCERVSLALSCELSSRMTDWSNYQFAKYMPFEAISFSAMPGDICAGTALAMTGFL